MSPHSKNNDKEVASVAQKILGFCAAVLLGVILLYLAVELLAQFWGWLVLIAAIIVALFAGIGVYRWWRDRW